MPTRTVLKECPESNSESGLVRAIAIVMAIQRQARETEVHVLIFELDGPCGRDAVFQAGAQHVTHECVVVAAPQHFVLARPLLLYKPQSKS